MLISHAPIGYLTSRLATKKLAQEFDPRINRWGVWLGFIVGAMPDIDFIYYYLVDASSGSHRTALITHTPFFWILLFSILYIVSRIRKSMVGVYLAWVGLVAALSHLILDSLLSEVQWLYPFTTQDWGLVNVAWFRQVFGEGVIGWLGFEFVFVWLALAYVWWQDRKQVVLKWVISAISVASFGLVVTAVFLAGKYIALDAEVYYADLDNDGIVNWHDLDMDGDGIDNIRDPDANGNGIPNEAEILSAAQNWAGVWHNDWQWLPLELGERAGFLSNVGLVQRSAEQAGVFFTTALRAAGENDDFSCFELTVEDSGFVDSVQNHVCLLQTDNSNAELVSGNIVLINNEELGIVEVVEDEVFVWLVNEETSEVRRLGWNMGFSFLRLF